MKYKIEKFKVGSLVRRKNFTLVNIRWGNTISVDNELAVTKIQKSQNILLSMNLV